MPSDRALQAQGVPTSGAKKLQGREAAETAEEDAELRRLHPEERAAILLAKQVGADFVDEKDARRATREPRLSITGLIGLLDVAASDGLVDLPAAVEELGTTSFRAAPSLLK